MVQSGDVVVLVGTMKGAFLLFADGERSTYDVRGPYLKGSEVYAMAYDGREGRQRVLSSARHMVWGALLASTDDWGETWDEPTEPTIAFPEGTDAALANIWQLHAPDHQPDVVWAGVEPAALFRSANAGRTFSLVRSLWDHPHRPQWQPGGGGLALHTVVTDARVPERLHVAVSAGGHYRSDDGGETWQARNNGIRVEFMPESHPEFGQCVHKVAADAATPGRLFAQNHGGLYRSDDAGDSWQDIGQGVVSDFGFPMVTHPRQGGTAYCFPLQGAEYRASPDGQARVYRTTDGGESWEALTKGLPQDGAHLTVLRDAFTADRQDPAGLYFGTRSGEVFASNDEGESWQQIAAHLPAVTCVKVANV